MFVAKTASALSWRRMSTITSAKTTDVKSWQDIPSLPRGLPYIGNFYYVTKKPYGVGQMAKQLGEYRILEKTSPSDTLTTLDDTTFSTCSKPTIPKALVFSVAGPRQ